MATSTITEITASSPLEHEALTRFLSTVTALVVRAAGPDWDPRLDTRFPPDAVETALHSLTAHLDLAGPVAPYMQDTPTAGSSDFNASPVTSLSLDRPNVAVGVKTSPDEAETGLPKYPGKQIFSVPAACLKRADFVAEVG